MSEETICFVAYPSDKAIVVLDQVLRFLRSTQNAAIDSFWGYSSKVISVISVDFFWRPLDAGIEKRTLSLVSGCGGDYSDTYTGDKVILSLGCWGEHKEIMTELSKYLKANLGCQTWLCLNGATDDFVEVTVENIL